MIIDRGGNGNDEDGTGGQIVGSVVKERCAAAAISSVSVSKRGIAAGFKLFDPIRIRIEPDDAAVLAKFHRQRQTDIAQSDDANGFGLQLVISGMNGGHRWHSLVVIVAEPVDEFLDTVAEIGLRLIAREALQQRGICPGSGHIAHLHGHEIALRLLA